jgi:hypothetical protein
MEKLELEPFKTIDLYDVLGKYEFNKLNTTGDFEDMCFNLFYLSKTQNHDKNRGDFVNGNVYWDHKNCKVVPTKVDKYNYLIKVKYSNVFAKVWIQLAMKELDEIIKHVPNDYRLKLLRYKTEIHIDDLRHIDYTIEKLRGKVEDTNSYCLKYDIDFTDFSNQLCIHNVKKYANLILIHNKAMYFTENGKSYYTITQEQTQHLLTPIDINRASIDLDYIGFGGFKIVVSKYESKKEYLKLDFLKPLYDEIDLVTDLIKYQNELIEDNSMSCRYSKRSKWDFGKFNNHIEEYCL